MLKNLQHAHKISSNTRQKLRQNKVTYTTKSNSTRDISIYYPWFAQLLLPHNFSESLSILTSNSYPILFSINTTRFELMTSANPLHDNYSIPLSQDASMRGFNRSPLFKDKKL